MNDYSVRRAQKDTVIGLVDVCMIVFGGFGVLFGVAGLLDYFENSKSEQSEYKSSLLQKFNEKKVSTSEIVIPVTKNNLESICDSKLPIKFNCYVDNGLVVLGPYSKISYNITNSYV